MSITKGRHWVIIYRNKQHLVGIYVSNTMLKGLKGFASFNPHSSSRVIFNSPILKMRNLILK